jgi:site-specific recombinase XerD
MRPGEVYTKNEINIILKNISKRCPTGIRNRAIVGLLYGSGVRCQELIDLYPSDVDVSTGRVTVKNGKGSRYRVVGLPEEIGAMVLLCIGITIKKGEYKMDAIMTAHMIQYLTVAIVVIPVMIVAVYKIVLS